MPVDNGTLDAELPYVKARYQVANCIINYQNTMQYSSRLEVTYQRYAGLLFRCTSENLDNPRPHKTP